MKLPNLELAEVPERKITHYLLNPAHPAGGSKAVFFLRLVHANGVAASDDSPYGTRYAVQGPLASPLGSRLNVRSVWFIETGDRKPRLVTAYPYSKS